MINNRAREIYKSFIGTPILLVTQLLLVKEIINLVGIQDFAIYVNYTIIIGLTSQVYFGPLSTTLARLLVENDKNILGYRVVLYFLLITLLISTLLISIMSFTHKFGLTFFYQITYAYALVLCVVHGLNGLISVIFNSIRARGFYSATISLPGVLSLIILKTTQPQSMDDIIYALIFGYFISSFTLLICSSYYLRTPLFYNSKIGTGAQSFTSIQNWFVLSFPIMCWGSFVWIQQNIDKLIINQILTDIELSKYVIHLQVAYTPIIITVAAIVQYITPMLYQLYQNKCDPKTFLHRVYVLLFLMYVSSSMILWFFGSYFIAFLSTNSLEANIVLLQTFAFTGFVYALLQVLNLQLTANYIIKPRLPFQIIASIITVGAVYFFTLNYGIIGSVIGILIGLLVKVVSSIFLRLRYNYEVT